MAMARQNQSNAMLYTVITFVGLFILTTILAVVFYLKAEEQRNQYETAQDELANLASTRELRNINAIVGQKERNSSRLGQMTKYLDQLHLLLTGSEPQETSAEVKVSELQETYNDILIETSEGMGFATEPNGPGTFRMIEV